ncbi:MAG: acetolactate synthase small subunit [Actinobacteria bacterium]|nr:acetolactate synthase small subunit [Actinomycetota bacterium]
MSQHVLSLLVEDKPGLLTRVAGLFARRGFNIESLAVGATEAPGFSRITKLVNVIQVVELEPDTTVERDHMLIKVATTADTKAKVLETVTLFGARVVDEASEALMVEITDETVNCDAFVKALAPFGIKELVQSGVLAMAKGSDSFSQQILGTTKAN